MPSLVILTPLLCMHSVQHISLNLQCYGLPSFASARSRMPRKPKSSPTEWFSLKTYSRFSSACLSQPPHGGWSVSSYEWWLIRLDTSYDNPCCLSGRLVNYTCARRGCTSDTFFSQPYTFTPHLLAGSYSAFVPLWHHCSSRAAYFQHTGRVAPVRGWPGSPTFRCFTFSEVDVEGLLRGIVW